MEVWSPAVHHILYHRVALMLLSFNNHKSGLSITVSIISKKKKKKLCSPFIFLCSRGKSTCACSFWNAGWGWRCRKSRRVYSLLHFCCEVNWDKEQRNVITAQTSYGYNNAWTLMAEEKLGFKVFCRWEKKERTETKSKTWNQGSHLLL